LAALVIFFAVEEFTVVHACGELMGHCAVHRLGWGALTALFLHSLTDGLAIGVAFLSSENLGALVAVAVLVHKTSDGLTLASLFRQAGHGRGRTAALTGVLALATPLGVLAAALARPWVGPSLLSVLLGLAAGGFLYVSMADVLPRLHRTRDPWCWVFLLIGASLSALAPHH
jgi:ZIP family zinc transporter